MVGIEEVARRAGVSTATVSRALRGLPHVADATRQRVVEVASELGYTAHPYASGLASGRSTAIGMVVPYLGSWFFGQVAVGAHEAVSREDRDLLVFAADTEGAIRALTSPTLRKRVAGLVVVDLPLRPGGSRSADAIDVPAVAVGAASGLQPVVRVDDRSAAHAAVAHLLGLGHTRIGLVGDDEGVAHGLPVPTDRLAGWSDALRGAGIEPDPRLQASGRFTADGGAEAARHLLALEEPPTAIFAMSDEMACGVLGAARRAGLRVPEDLAVVGFDDHEIAEHLALTTIRQEPAGQGHAAARWLLSRLAGNDPDPPEPWPWDLVVRQSTASN